MIQYIRLLLLQSTRILDEYSRLVTLHVIRPVVFRRGQYLHFFVVQGDWWATGDGVSMLVGLGG